MAWMVRKVIFWAFVALILGLAAILLMRHQLGGALMVAGLAGGGILPVFGKTGIGRW